MAQQKGFVGTPYNINTIAGNGGYGGDGGHASAASLFSPQGIAIDAAGNLYIADIGNNVIRKVSSSGIITTIAGNKSLGGSLYSGSNGDGGPATAARVRPVDVAVDGMGNVFIADNNAGIRKVNTSGIISTYANVGASGIAIDADGNIYLAGANIVRKISTSGIITTVAGTGTAGYTGDGGPATLAKLNSSFKVAVDGAGNLYIADVSNSVIRKVNTSGIISTFAGNHILGSGFSGDGGQATNAKIDAAHALATDALGNLFIADYSGKIRKVNTSGIISSIAGSGYGWQGHSGDDGPATAAKISWPYGLATDATGNLYISDTYNQAIRKVNTSGIISLVAGNYGYGGDAGAATEATLHNPHSVSICHSGDVLIADNMANVVRRISTSGIITTIAGSGILGYSGDGGSATDAALSRPSDIVEDIYGNIFIADKQNGAIRKVNTVGIISTIATGLSSPHKIILDYLGNLYVSDGYNSIYKVSQTGNVTPIAGNNSLGYSGDGGPATNAQLFYPEGMAMDAMNNLYISDFQNNVIRKVDTGGIITTFAGNGIHGSLGDGGPATAANLSYPKAIAFDGSGNLFITTDESIRKVDSSGIISTVITSTDANDNAYDIAIAPNGDIICPISLKRIIRKISNIASLPLSSLATYVSPTAPPGVYHGEIAILNSSCRTTYPVSVTVLARIAGSSTMCVGSSTTFTHPTSGGTWSSSNTSVATIGSTGILSAITSGTSTITYAVEVNGATRYVTKLITVNGMPSVTLVSTAVATIGSTIAPLNYTAALYSPEYSIAWSLVSQMQGFENTVDSVDTIAGIGYSGYSGDGGPANDAKLNNPSGVAIDDAGNLYISDQNNYVVRKVSANGEISTIAGNGTYGYSGDGGEATAASLSQVTAIALDIYGNIYIADEPNMVIRKVNTAGIISTIAGNGSYENSGDGGAATSAGIKSPFSLAVDISGNIFVVTASGYPYVRKITPDGIISTIAGNGIVGYSGDGGPAIDASFNGILGIATDEEGNVFLGDYGNRVVRKIDTFGIISTVAGCSCPIDFGYGDLAIESGFINLLGLAAKGGSLYIGDGGYIRKVSTAGIISTISSDCSYPRALAVANNGDVFVAELYDNIIRKIGTSIVLPPSPVSIPVPPIVGIGNYLGSFTVHNGPCLTSYDINLRIIDTISGVQEICANSASLFSHTHLGGTWVSSNPEIASVGSSSGLVTGLAAGTATISYIFEGVSATKVITVNPLPDPGYISSDIEGCVGSTFSISSSIPDGIWSSSNEEIATIDFSGLITGHLSGTVVISYYLANSCGDSTASVTVSVNPIPSIDTVVGERYLCVSSNTTLSVDLSGGIWNSDNEVVATVNSMGTVTGNSAGTATISYFFENSCGSVASYAIITVNPIPTAGSITGLSTINLGASTALSNPTEGGTWSLSNASIATVGSTGIVSGVAAGTTIISYTVTNSCGSVSATKTVTVNAVLETPIAGTLTVCVGSTTTLSNATSGGSWSSSNNLKATITSDGVVSGLNAGTVVISYTLSGVSVTAVVTVYALPTAGTLSGATMVCVGSVATVSKTGTGGEWSSSSTDIATVGTTGIVSGISAGSTTISYTVSNGCGSVAATRVVTVIALPDAGTISGASAICRTTTTLLTSTVSGGTWNSNYTAGATVNASTGLVTGVAAGPVIISYRMTNSCGTAYAMFPMSILNAPVLGVISGSTTLCSSSTTTLTNTTAGGTWISTNTGAATINPATGAATGIAAGTTTISYNVTNICGSATVARVLTVNPLPVAAVVSGITALPASTTTTLTATPSGGTWLSASGSVASINASTGVLIAGSSMGNVIISYTRTNSCGSVVTTVAVTVTAAITPITGTRIVCQGATKNLANATAGGTWSIANAVIATVSTTGVITGIGAGTTTVTYNFSGGGNVTATITVNAAPAAYIGSSILCSGSQLNLGSIIAGCTWSGTTAVANVIAATGIVTGGNTLGTVNISYTNAAGCRTITQLTVIAAVGATTGISSPCTGSTFTALNSTPGGTWSSSNTSRATIDETSGLLTAISGGTVTISYTVSAGCRRTTVVTVASPTAIVGNPNVCLGQTSYMSSTGGTWSGSNNPAVASLAFNGFVTGVSEGTAVITYRSTINSTCFVTKTVTVNPLPSVIVPVALCPTETATLVSSPSGGRWTSANPTTVSVDSLTGLVTGVYYSSSISVVNITYTLPTTCSRSAVVTVNQSPAPIGGGARNICIASSTTLTSSTSGCIWSSASPSVATVTSGGLVNGVSAGLATISYTNTVGCASTAVVTVNAMPGANSGTASLCRTATTTLSNAAGAGTWTSSNSSTASVGMSTGIVTGTNVGTANITYSRAAGCISVTVVTVNSCARPGLTEGADGDNNVFTVSPNPTTGAINLTTDVAGKVVIYTIDGKQLQQYEVKEGTTTISLPAGLANGVYMLRFNGADGSKRMVRLVYQQ